MKKPSYRGLVVEMASLLIVFAAAFLVGEFAVRKTGNVWWGITAGSLAFAGILYTITRVVSRVCPPSPASAQSPASQAGLAKAGTAPGAAEIAGFLFVFLVAYIVGHFVASRTGHLWLGGAAGSLAVAGIVIALAQISRRLSAAPATTAPATTAPSFENELAWAEPRDFRKADLEASRKWVLNMIGLIAGITAVFLAIANWYGLGAEVNWKLLVTAGGIAVLFLGMMARSRLTRIIVKITDKAIVQELVKTSMVYRFGTIDHCELGKMLVGGKIYSVLVVALKNGDREILCVEPSVSAQVLGATLKQRGVNVVTRTDTMSEQALLSEDADPYPKLAGIEPNENRRD